MSGKRRTAIYHRKLAVIKRGKIGWETEVVPVRVMAVAEGYALVRRRGVMPFAVALKNMTITTKDTP